MGTTAKTSPPLVLVFGDDEYGVKQRARGLFQSWCGDSGGMDHETIDAAAANAGEALQAISRLREALQTLPFFGGAKVVWFRDCNFLGDDRTSASQAVTEETAALAQELKEFRWDNVRLIISASKVDRRKGFFKTLEKIGSTEMFTDWSEEKDAGKKTEAAAAARLRELKKSIDQEALAALAVAVGPNPRLLQQEVEKLAVYAGEQERITAKDVAAVVTHNKQAKAFAVGDALGDRDLPKLLRRLDEELWETKLDSKKSEIGLLYGLITKIRVMLFLKEMTDLKMIRPCRDYNAFKAQLDKVSPGQLPSDKRFNPLAMNAYVLFKALPQADHYTKAELIEAMNILLEANIRLISSKGEKSAVLQQALVKIVGEKPAA